MAQEQTETRVFSVDRPSVRLYPAGEAGQVSILAKILDENSGASNQGWNKGDKSHPYDFNTLKTLQDHNEHHATCVHAKVSAIVGLGFLNEAQKQERQNRGTATTPEQAAERVARPIYQESRPDEVLDPLCMMSWQDTLTDVCEDYVETGNGYIEVVRTRGGITGLHHLPAKDTKVYVEDNRKYHYVVTGESAIGGRRFAAFGDKDGFIRRTSDGRVGFEHGDTPNDPDKVSEVIHFRRPSGRSRWYGRPDWVSAVPVIEMVQMLHQMKFDFFNNRGVPEFMLFITGGRVSEKDWEAIEKAVKNTIGLGNAHKTIAVNLPGKDLVVQVEKLAIDAKSEDEFKSFKETAGLSIVTAHKVPPLLAGIQIPGKLGATNEMSQALMAFQTLFAGPAQTLFTRRLVRTLGSDGAGLGLRPEDFVLRSITDDLDPDKLDTVGRMRQELPEANAQGRDVGEGVKD